MKALSAALVLVALTSVADASYLSDPSPVVTISGTTITIYKELTGYSNYGHDGAADILYSGESGTWHFDLTGIVNPADVQAATFVIALIGDDHGSGTSPYTCTVQVNGGSSAACPTLPYGSPYGSPFTNWEDASYAVAALGSSNTITLHNTSFGSGNWIGVDWVELQLTDSSLPEPGTATLLALPLLAGLLWRRRRQRPPNSL
jgi:hypothetical protein